MRRKAETGLPSLEKGHTTAYRGRGSEKGSQMFMVGESKVDAKCSIHETTAVLSAELIFSAA